MQLQNATALVTGANRGIGRAAVDTNMLAGIDMAQTSPADIATAVLPGID